MAVTPDQFWTLLDLLPAVERTEWANYVALKVEGKGFGYLWPATATVGLKQTIEEQIALVAERPEVFEIQFTAGRFGWVVVHLDGVDLDELCELTFEAWRLTASESLVEQQGDIPPTF